MGKGAGEVGLIGQAGRGGNIRSGHAESQKSFRSPQADCHQHLMRRHVEMGFELALKMPRGLNEQRVPVRRGYRTHVVVMQIVAYARKAMGAFLRYRGMARQRLEGIDQIQQQPFLR